MRDAVLIRTGYGCNNACRFCVQGRLRQTAGDRPSDEIATEITSGSLGGRTVVIAGGEATLRPELPTWVKLAKAQGARRICLQTNGRLLAYRKLTRSLVAAGVDVFAVALHGHNAELHDWLTRVDGSFDQAIRGIRNAQLGGGAVLINTVVTRSNDRNLVDIVRFAYGLGVGAIRLIWPREEGTAAELAASIIPSEELAAPNMERAMGFARELGMKVSCEVPDTMSEVRSGGRTRVAG